MSVAVVRRAGGGMRRAGVVIGLVLALLLGALPAGAGTPVAPPAPRPAPALAAPAEVKGPPPSLSGAAGGRSSGTRSAQAGAQAAESAPVTNYFYAAASTRRATEGTQVRAQISKPELAPGDHHSLFEVAAQSADGKHIVEVGWTVDRALNGDDRPHLFVYHWVDRNPGCYNGCGFVQVDDDVVAGMELPFEAAATLAAPGETLTSAAVAAPAEGVFAIRHRNRRWWVGYNGVWFGYFPDSLWSNGFTQAGLVQWFGEVAASSSAPCSDMGTGVLGTAPAATLVSEIALLDKGSPVPPSTISLYNPNPALYVAESLGADTAGLGAVRYGGPGAC